MASLQSTHNRPEPPPAAAVQASIAAALREDLGTPARDATSRAMPHAAGATVQAQVIAREPGIAAGMCLLEPILHAAVTELADAGEVAVDAVVSAETIVPDGHAFAAGDVLARLDGDPYVVLAAERTMLNFLQRLCAMATLTHAYVTAVEHTQASILDTRKTTPGLRHLEKFAVRCGGGENHRMGLHDVAMIKDTHVDAAGSMTAAIEAVRAASPDLELVVEVRNERELAQTLPHLPDVVLLDNMDLRQLRQATAAIRRQAGHAGRPMLSEASGGVVLERVASIAETGVDRISVGALTHSAGVLDIAMLMGAPRGR